ncbi:class I SAM-dependent methyltransferase [Rummeliibacillus stabekisii]|uniref:SAM-dependent methyltransferase n=1 Tax=Rummeliibacillus stabekisii TaxID=241244 RepID=UPI002040F1D9|nr:class I SAM-dependent methyltransferase [Rummeliibacillus stabekisii]MCM3318137.1 class I SAM-dependent methyltransferase [Rummeliibacillus stabekisii]
MTLKSIELSESTLTFLSTYKLFEEDEVQQVQLQHRLDLVKEFEIKKGMRILEIGCGQGDTTVALADAVGEEGKVIGIDNASREYGAPLTLGQATDMIKKSTLGERITFHFEMDFDAFGTNEVFDIAVLSHSSWYFKRPGDLLRYFKKLRKIAKRICFAEWDLNFTDLNQRAHFCAASILALHSNFVNNDGNIQNLFHQAQIQEMLEQANFCIEKQCIVNAMYLQDGQWETSYANSIRKEFSVAPPMIQTMVNSYYELMKISNDNKQSLNSFVICAR